VVGGSGSRHYREMIESYGWKIAGSFADLDPKMLI
jgi:hypothetical protein